MSGIHPDAWAEMGEQAIITAFDLLDQQHPGSTSSGKEAPAGWELQSE